MNKQRTELLIVMREWPVAQPVAEFICISRPEQFLEGAEAVAEAHRTRMKGKKVQVMIAQYGDYGVAEFSHETQCF